MRLIETVFYLLFILVPLILTPWNFELFEFNKMLTVYTGTILIAAGWAIEMIRQKKLLFSRTPLDRPLLIFLASQILATIFSIDLRTSIWGYYSRFHGGLASTVCYLLLYWAYAQFMAKKTKKSVTIILSTGLVVALYGIAEFFGIDKHLWQQKVQERVFSTLGQPNWLAAYLVMLIPLALTKRRHWWLLPIFLAALYFTHSRSGYLGLAAAGAVFCFFKWRKITLITAVLTAAALMLFRQQLPLLSLTAKLTEETPLVHTGGSSSFDIRRVVWTGAIDIWKQYPIFGSGVETFAYTYYNFRPVAHNLLSEWDFLYNKAHNEMLNFLATTGAFGLGSYLLLIVWTGVWLWSQNQPGLLAAYLGVTVINFFGFSVVPVALLFFLFPAFALKSFSKSKPAYRPSNNWQALGITGVLLITFYGLLFIFKSWRADYLFNLGRNQVKAQMLHEGWQNLYRATTLIPKEPVFRNDLAEAEAQLAIAYSSPSAELSREFSRKAETDTDLVISQNPVNLNFWRSRIKIFLTLGLVNSDYYPKALEAFDRAINLAPTDPKLTLNLALVYNQLGQTGLAEQLLVKTVELKPNYEAARQNLGLLYQQTNRPKLAREQFEYIIKFLNPENAIAKTEGEKL